MPDGSGVLPKSRLLRYSASFCATDPDEAARCFGAATSALVVRLAAGFALRFAGVFALGLSGRLPGGSAAGFRDGFAAAFAAAFAAWGAARAPARGAGRLRRVAAMRASIHESPIAARTPVPPLRDDAAPRNAASRWAFVDFVQTPRDGSLCRIRAAARTTSIPNRHGDEGFAARSARRSARSFPPARAAAPAGENIRALQWFECYRHASVGKNGKSLSNSPTRRRTPCPNKPMPYRC
ncbi:MAG TPA: hypothetical protein VGK20_11345 [Candidatus Binatia bacterium]